MNVRHDMVACYAVRPTPAGSFEFLLMRRAAGDFMGGAWSVVRGTSHRGETAWAAALRELLEETALAPREFYQLDTVDVFYLAAADTTWHCPGFCAIVEPDAPIVLNEEHDAFRWVDRSQVLDAVLWPGERTQLAELFRAILDDGPAKPYLRIRL